MSKSFGLRKFKFLIICVLFLFSICPSFADENFISNVVISNSREIPNSYELNIDSTLTVPYKVVQESDNSIYFDLKNSVLSENVSTYYDDVANIDNVVVKQMDKSKVRIYVEGKNAKNTELIFVNSLFEQQTPKKRLVINRPINEYRATSYRDLENQEDIQDWDDNSFNFSHLSASLFSWAKDGTFGIVLIIASLFAILLMSIKMIANKLSQDNEPLIGAGNVYVPKNNINENMHNPYNSSNLSNSNTNTDRAETLKIAQEHLNIAHQKYQTYLQNKYQNNVKSPYVSPVTQGIALNQYQKSTQNPYKDQEVIKIKREYTDDILHGENTIIPRRPKAEPVPFSSPYIQKAAPKIVKPQVSKKDTNLKFLESVTKIYEQSGREDLANGLKNSISKTKIKA